MLIDFNKAVMAIAFAVAACLSMNLQAADDDKPVKADNTKVNERDRNKAEPTADQQNQNRSDVELTAKIRQAVVNDKSLSTNAHNIKIITQNGLVTLKGPVKNDAEKSTIEKAAMSVAGDKNVTSQIDIAP